MNDNFADYLKNNLTNLVQSLEKANKNINDFNVFNVSIEDLTDILSKSSKILGATYQLYTLAQQNALKNFLKGISSQINLDNPLNPKDKQKLDDYLSKESNINFIYNTIRKSLTANSL